MPSFVSIFVTPLFRNFTPMVSTTVSVVINDIDLLAVVPDHDSHDLLGIQ